MQLNSYPYKERHAKCDSIYVWREREKTSAPADTFRAGTKLGRNAVFSLGRDGGI